MMRNRTHRQVVRELERQHAHREDRLLTIIATQNDRIMQMAGSPWGPPPLAAPTEIPTAPDPYQDFSRPDLEVNETGVY